MSTVATYRIGPPVRPPIYHDNGFLDELPPRPPTRADRIKFAEWAALLEAGEAGQRVPLVPHNDLPDALAAYRHFLYGKGTDRVFSYERYVANDGSGKITLANAVLDFRRGVEDLAAGRPAGASPSLQVTSGPIPCGSKEPDVRKLFPYPATENWQKALGSHVIGSISVGAVAGRPTFVGIMTLHAEDRFNFNPGMNDIATGLPDSANGIFEVTGLAKQYMNYATLQRSLRWEGATAEPAEVTRIAASPDRKPDDNRRARNRI
jgi:hypothetical protein